jgi:hypothetical protein
LDEPKLSPIPPVYLPDFRVVSEGILTFLVIFSGTTLEKLSEKSRTFSRKEFSGRLTNSTIRQNSESQLGNFWDLSGFFGIIFRKMRKSREGLSEKSRTFSRKEFWGRLTYSTI